MQIRLLRFLDTQEVKKIGATKYKKLDTRIFVASNRDLRKLVNKETFKEDLLYRLSKFVIHLPSLRERKEDIKPLIDCYINFYNKKYRKKIQGVTNEAFELLYTYEWPGNVRDLKNEIERCVFFCNKRFISKDFLSEEISRVKPSFFPLTEMKQKLMQEYITKVLSYTDGSVTKAARILKTTKRTIYRNVKRY